MKKNWLPVFMAMMILTVAGCQKMDAYKDRFQKGKEISYPGILDSLKILPGNGRVMLTGLFMSDPKIVKYRIYWNGGLDSMDQSITRSAGVDTVRQIINNLQEGNGSFAVRTFDAAGNPSVLVNASGNIYGSNYQSGIINRGFRSAENPFFGRLIIDWLETNTTVVSTSVAYTAVDGSSKTFETRNISAHKDTITDIRPGTNALIISRYLPEPAAIDTFAVSGADTIKLDPFPPFNRAGWVITGFSDQEATGEGTANGRTLYAFDNNPATFWQSQWSGSSPAYPHWVTVDMGSSNVINGLLIWPRQNSTSGTPKDGKIEVSTDGIGWMAAGTFTVQNNNTAYQRIALSQPTAPARYVKIIFLSNYAAGPYLALAELNLY
ncbi:DUF4998 domain-containing protein [Niabella drilacis]|uniref:F5/8 type C domain-containing protein n=1 Tax=Niabella drilacis (strain DSM 25811 / CCM 8410 / CCUG 62505 / LMG 26954 / E90) TaxID=1285928 RepID=A0A1G7A5E3_NIADE|nr:DUF4998 domain-containing protein [Niabella drilacis]SDE10069.1 F5/8 type C domain-containing protein [Niabella drilacis]